MVLPNGESKSCTFCLCQNLHTTKSVTEASQTGKVVKFTKSACHILDRNDKIVAKATKVGSLCQIDHMKEIMLLNNQKQKMRGTNVMVILV